MADTDKKPMQPADWKRIQQQVQTLTKKMQDATGGKTSNDKR